MKTKLYFVITLLTFFTLIVLPRSFAQGPLAQPSVRLVYLHPNNRPAQPDKYGQLRQLIKDAQQFFADEMQRHGFGKRTFIFESDKDGEPLVHRVTGRFAEEYYNRFTGYKAWEEIREYFDELHHIYFIAIDLESPWEGKHCGEAGVTFWPSNGGAPQRRYYDTITQREEILGGFAVIPASGRCIDSNAFKLVAHELGHAFGLGHDFREGIASDYLMAYGNSTRLSKCAAEWLSVSPFFTTNPISDNTPGEIRLISTPTYSAEGVRFRFEVADTNELHQAQLLLPEARGEVLSDCKQLESKTSTIEFISTELTIEPVDSVMLQIIDKNGGITWATFLVDIASLLPPPKVVSIPDANLAEAVREALDLSPNARITDQEMWGLIELNASEKQIKNLTGLEHATQLTHLFFYENQISNLDPLLALTHLRHLGLDGNNIRDIGPLAQMKQLKTLFIGGNPISDFTPIAKLNELKALALFGNNIRDIVPIANLQQLRWLYLSYNQIQDVNPLAQLTHLETLHLQNNAIHDISPLTNLTKLTDLKLEDNQISDVSPLTGLVNLETLSLIRNPIKDREPLLAMLRRNPDIKIYLKEGSDPLPVSLSRFRAELTDTGIIIKWTTESELDNAGFNILRSETKNGEFKIVNPQLIQGAGTTSERHTYTWTDTTAKPNVVYYYRIEDISHAGVREQLATVRMRGYVSAAGKFITRWSDLKLQE